MSKLDDLERRWKRSGAVDDEAVYLLARVRMTDLAHERLEAAGLVGHPGAALALKLKPIEAFDPWADRVALGSPAARAWIALHLGAHVLSVVRPKVASFPSTSLDLWDSAVVFGRKVLEKTFDAKNAADRVGVTSIKALFLGYANDRRDPRERTLEGALQKCFEWVLTAPAPGQVDIKTALQRSVVSVASITATDEAQALRRIRFHLAKLAAP